jgi:hypothetical protein
MSRARVTSIDQLEELHASLARFGTEAQEALAAAEIEIRRTQEEVHDRLKFWVREVDRRHEDVNRARSELSLRQSLRGEGRTGAVEQEIALRKAQQRLREAEDKVTVCRRWLTALPQAINDYQGPARQLAGTVDSSLRQGLAILQGQVASLRAYAALQTPSAEKVVAPAGPPPRPADAPAQPSPPEGGSPA